MVKGIAVSQIILLVLGILVLAVVAYLLYSNFVTTGGTLSAEQCRAAATRACTGCSIANLGSTSNCDVSFLDQAGKQCVGEGKIPGTASTSCPLGTDGLYSCNEDAIIDCSQYVGGTTPGECILPDATTNLCPDGKELPTGSSCCSV